MYVNSMAAGKQRAASALRDTCNECRINCEISRIFRAHCESSHEIWDGRAYRKAEKENKQWKERRTTSE